MIFQQSITYPYGLYVSSNFDAHKERLKFRRRRELVSQRTKKGVKKLNKMIEKINLKKGA
ncbi:MAG: hypothetical protein B7Y25_02415 [Alphaproteobacteria bacterium 16-39-46]|nr:MAG: hypothetical protein B7Y25_02415 [Alphaproteobacteria bacterium 16-39-46]OZA43581.1 MAG: hypothetical protein B7X84_02720 [Alphaproteobacteria bacterium 17-39-52]